MIAAGLVVTLILTLLGFAILAALEPHIAWELLCHLGSTWARWRESAAG